MLIPSSRRIVGGGSCARGMTIWRGAHGMNEALAERRQERLSELASNQHVHDEVESVVCESERQKSSTYDMESSRTRF